jgi:hypothetical protein
MKKVSRLIMLISLIPLSSCTPLVITKLETSLPLIDTTQVIKVLGLSTDIPADAEVLGTIKIGDSGFTVNCTYKVVLDKAKQEARKVGGNAIKITEHIPPGFSSCHRITAKILKINNANTTSLIQREVGTLNHNYAILNIYSDPAPGVILNYDLHLGDSIICRVKNNLKATIAIKMEGLNSLWAKTDARSEIQIDIKYGHTYYLRCSTSNGELVVRPILEIVDPNIGIKKFDIFSNSK